MEMVYIQGLAQLHAAGPTLEGKGGCRGAGIGERPYHLDATRSWKARQSARVVTLIGEQTAFGKKIYGFSGTPLL